MLGLCGGYQMLGRAVADPDGIEGPAGTATGLGLLDVETMLAAEKRLDAGRRRDLADGAPFAGYEMHMGVTAGPRLRAAVRRASPTAAPKARCRPTAGSPAPISTACSPTTASAPPGSPASAPGGAGIAYDALVEATLDALAAHLAAHIDLDRLLTLAR